MIPPRAAQAKRTEIEPREPQVLVGEGADGHVI